MPDEEPTVAPDERTEIRHLLRLTLRLVLLSAMAGAFRALVPDNLLIRAMAMLIFFLAALFILSLLLITAMGLRNMLGLALGLKGRTVLIHLLGLASACVLLALATHAFWAGWSLMTSLLVPT